MNKQCSECKQDKPVSEYYVNSYGYTIARCKPCQRKFMERYTPQKSKPPTHETKLVEYLNRHGIFTQHGNQTNYAHVDVVAWGMIRIEAKLMKLDTKQGVPYYYAGNSPSQVKNGWKADIVCLILQGVHYFFDVEHPAFYRKGKLKTKILYTPMKQYGAKEGSVQFTDEDFLKAQQDISKIESLRKEWIASKLKPKPLPLPFVYPKAS